MSEGPTRHIIMTKREAQKFDRLYTKFVRAIELQGYAEKTVDSYARSIRRVAAYFDCCPDHKLSKEDLQQYFADLLKTHSWSTIKHDLNALRHYWKLVLGLDWDWVLIVKPPKKNTLPDILSADEINRVLECIQKPQYAVLFFIMYTMGLRIGEALELKVGDIDREHNRVHVRLGKGNKDRFVKLPTATYRLLREFWCTHRNPEWIFPSLQANNQDRPMDRGAAQVAIKKAVKEAGIHKHITSHSLRHCYGAHLVQAGLNLRAVQDLMGHEDPRTTALYTQLTDAVKQDALEMVNTLANKINSPLKRGE